LISLTDLPVSLLALAGLQLPGADGADLHRLFTDGAASGADACYIFDLIPCHQSAWRGTDAWRGIRTKRHTYACHADGSLYVLFDNDDDPFQMDNLVARPACAALQHALYRQTVRCAAQHDALLPWPDLVRRFGLRDEWNRSQKHFGLPLLDSHN
jgi:arylsulfatase A-like enzyme